MEESVITRGPHPHCELKLTEREKVWQEGIHLHDEHIQKICTESGPMLPQHSPLTENNIVSFVIAHDLLEDNIVSLDDDAEFYFMALAHILEPPNPKGKLKSTRLVDPRKSCLYSAAI